MANKPEEVFTPRAAEVNQGMYVARTALELALSNALRGNLHIVIHGESGTGKSWLYKKNLADAGITFAIANLANASRLGSIAAELKNLVDRDGNAKKTGFEEKKSAGIDAVIASAALEHTGQYELGKMEPFEASLAALRAKAGKNQAVLVFDNLEAIFDSEALLKELADLLILCDDERYTKYKTKILIVGVPAGVREYYYKTPHHTTVANRLYELPEVYRLSRAECDVLVDRGFVEKLNYKVADMPAFKDHVAWITHRVPQMVHEYCLEVAFAGERRGEVGAPEIEKADSAWMSKSLSFAYSAVEKHLNERDTKAGRRNQALYALSLCDDEQFKAVEVEGLIRKEFPTSTKDTALNVAQTLSLLGATEQPLVRRSPKGDAFTFADPRYRMALRSMLRKTAEEKVEKRPKT